MLVEAFRGLETDLRLVIVGDAPYADEYQERLRAAGDDRVVFAGYQFGAAYRRAPAQRGRRSSCPTEVGGTHPVIVEAMAAGACIVVNDHAPNLETLGDAGVSYPGERRRGGTAASARSAARRPGGDGALPGGGRGAGPPPLLVGGRHGRLRAARARTSRPGAAAGSSPVTPSLPPGGARDA